MNIAFSARTVTMGNTDFRDVGCIGQHGATFSIVATVITANPASLYTAVCFRILTINQRKDKG
jgi:hypothetical protein